MFLIEDSHIGLTPYTHHDDKDMFSCWLDMDTQKGYNCYSMRIIKKLGFIHCLDGDAVENDCFTGQDRTMQEFRITKGMMEGFSLNT